MLIGLLCSYVARAELSSISLPTVNVPHQIATLTAVIILFSVITLQRVIALCSCMSDESLIPMRGRFPAENPQTDRNHDMAHVTWAAIKSLLQCVALYYLCNLPLKLHVHLNCAVRRSSLDARQKVLLDAIKFWHRVCAVLVRIAQLSLLVFFPLRYLPAGRK